jgi:hypothetical protein
MGPPHSKECEGALRTSLALCETLGFPIGSHKVEGPATSLAFLGILIDMEAGVLRLPAEKLAKLQDHIRQWQGKRASTKRDLLSLIGHLSHACRVVKSGRTFLRRMIDLSATPKELHHRVRLNKGFQSDLNWWAAFLEGWNGVSLFGGVLRQQASATVTSDASGSWGCGAYNNSGAWFQFSWPESWAQITLTQRSCCQSW